MKPVSPDQRSPTSSQLSRRERAMYAVLGGAIVMTLVQLAGVAVPHPTHADECEADPEVEDAPQGPTEKEIAADEITRALEAGQRLDDEIQARVALQQECVVKAISVMHLSESWDRNPDELREFADAAWLAGEVHDVDPMLLLAVAYRESRLRFLTGDDGEACGPWQHSVRYLPEVVSGEVTADYACEELMVDIDLAAHTAADRLARYGGRPIQRDVCHYQQGGTCRDADLRGEADTYSGRVLAVYDTFSEQCS